MALSRNTKLIAICVMAVFCLVLGRGAASHVLKPPSETVADALIFISDSDSIDAGRGSNAVYRIGLDGQAMKRLVGAIPHGVGYLHTSDIACERSTQQLVIASHQPDLNGFHHAILDGSGLHFDQPGNGDWLSATRNIDIAPDGRGIVASRQDTQFAEPRFSLVAGDLFTRAYKSIKPASASLSYVSPAWSPSGDAIATIIQRRNSDMSMTYQLAIISLSSGDEHILHATKLRISAVNWSPTGEWLALEMAGQIYKIVRDGGGLTRLSDHLGGARMPRWSPDGRMISYVAASSFPGFTQLMVMDAAGRGIRRVANIHGAVANGCWV